MDAETAARAPRLEKAPTGITGFDQISGGGLPRGRATLVSGGAGSGKTLFGLEFLVRGAQEFGEPGALLSFEESAEALAVNVASLGFDLDGLEQRGLLTVESFRVEPEEIKVLDGFNLDGLFARLDLAVRKVGAKRVVMDTIEVLFGELGHPEIIRAELIRLFAWCQDRGLTLVVTGERGSGDALTRYGIEEYVSDCVIRLDHRVTSEISTRRLRIVKYRGSVHGTNEYPFLIGAHGFQVLPADSMGLTYTVSRERISLGVPRLDEMLAGGVFRGSTVLITGSPGTGKTTLGAHAVDAACSRGERALLISFEESPDQVIRNMESVGIDLGRWVDAGSLTIWARRSTENGLEAHLGMLLRLLDEVEPDLVVLDAMASLSGAGEERQVTSTVAREIDLMKARGITAILTTLTHDKMDETSSLAISSLADTWLLLRNDEADGERNRLIFVIKSRGAAHSNQVREFVLSDQGAQLVDVFVGTEGVLTGSARRLEMEREKRAATTREEELVRRRRAMAHRRAEVDAEIARLRERLEAEESALEAEFSDAAADSAAARQISEDSASARSGPNRS
jgi:circadian clock protein KaiC